MTQRNIPVRMDDSLVKIGTGVGGIVFVIVGVVFKGFVGVIGRIGAFVGIVPSLGPRI